MEDNKHSVISQGSHSLVRAENSIAITEKLLLEKKNRDYLKAEYYYQLGWSGGEVGKLQLKI